MGRTVAQVGTHVGFGPVDEDLAHHPEELLRVGVRLRQPVRPGGRGGVGEAGDLQGGGPP